jgi:hypothetical protein
MTEITPSPLNNVITTTSGSGSVQKFFAHSVVSRIFRTLVWAERYPSLAQAVMAPLDVAPV